LYAFKQHSLLSKKLEHVWYAHAMKHSAAGVLSSNPPLQQQQQQQEAMLMLMRASAGTPCLPEAL
jgi:hypothetical protein